MHEATQRRLMRAAFLLCCVTPTLCVSGWAIGWAVPSHTVHIERELSRLTGLAARVDQIEHPTPRVVRLDGLQLLDPESRDPLVSFGELTIVRRDGRYDLVTDHATLVAQDQARLWQIVRSHVIEHDVLHDRSVRFVARSVQTGDRAASHQMFAVQGTVACNGSSTTIEARFATDPSSEQQVNVVVVRDRSRLPMRTELHVETADQRLPVSLLSRVAADRLGTRATFSGFSKTVWSGDDWQVELKGNVRQIDCQQILNAPLSLELTGQGEIVLDGATIDRSGIISAGGQLRIHDGEIGTALVRSIVSHALARPDPSLDLSPQARERISFRELAVDIFMDYRGMTVKGGCRVAGKPDARAVAVGAGGPLLWQPPNSELPYYFLAGALVPQDASAEAREAASRIQRHLPRYTPVNFRPRRAK